MRAFFLSLALVAASIPAVASDWSHQNCVDLHGMVSGIMQHRQSGLTKLQAHDWAAHFYAAPVLDHVDDVIAFAWSKSLRTSKGAREELIRVDSGAARSECLSEGGFPRILQK